jgi:hypothetical protein
MFVYMEDVKNEFKVIEEDLEIVEEKCERVNFYASYDVIIATIKLISIILYCCCKKKD